MHEGRLVAGKYRIAQRIAGGSMGDVYEAVHVGIGKRVAVKAMPRALASSAELRARFKREVRTAGMLESEYIVQVLDAGVDDGLGPYLVTELLLGEDLEVRIARERRLDVATAAAIGYEVARGLARAHAAGVVHRDLKPSNIFLADRDAGASVAKILDFGVSKRRSVHDELAADEEDEDEYATAAGVTLGTPDYMSPEQAQGRADLDGRSDVWSLAATMYEALSGKPPHSGGSPFVVMTRIVREDARPLAAVAPWVPSSLCKVVQGGLARDRDERTPDAASFAEAIALAVPEALWALRIPAPPKAEQSDDAPPSSANARVQFFRRGAMGRPVAV